MAEALIVTGPCGAGKTATAFECLELLEEAGTPAAMIDAELVYYHPAPPDDPFKERVAEVHDLHVWEVTSGFPALSAHILVANDTDCHDVRRALDALLHDQFDIAHTTRQVDHEGEELLEIEVSPRG